MFITCFAQHSIGHINGKFGWATIVGFGCATSVTAIGEQNVSEQFGFHQCDHIGVATGKAMLTEKTQPDGVTKYWQASTNDVFLFGSRVCCELVGRGRTKEQALERLEEEKRKLSESLWE